MTVVQYGGGTDNTYLHLIPGEHEGAKVDVTLRTLQQLDEEVYNVKTHSLSLIHI